MDSRSRQHLRHVPHPCSRACVPHNEPASSWWRRCVLNTKSASSRLMTRNKGKGSASANPTEVKARTRTRWAAAVRYDGLQQSLRPRSSMNASSARNEHIENLLPTPQNNTKTRTKRNKETKTMKHAELEAQQKSLSPREARSQAIPSAEAGPPRTVELQAPTRRQGQLGFLSQL